MIGYGVTVYVGELEITRTRPRNCRLYVVFVGVMTSNGEAAALCTWMSKTAASGIRTRAPLSLAAVIGLVLRVRSAAAEDRRKKYCVLPNHY